MLTAAGRQHLKPLGLQQKGRSRLWYDDRAWHLLGVEFQPGRGPGSYLNVGVMWLWDTKAHFVFHVGHRVEGHRPYSSDAQFERHAQELAAAAVQEIERYRGRLGGVADALAWLESDRHTVAHAQGPSPEPAPWPPRRGTTAWDDFHLGCCLGLMGQDERAVEPLDRFAAPQNDDPEWLAEARREAEELSLAARSGVLAGAVQHRIATTRQLHGLT